MSGLALLAVWTWLLAFRDRFWLADQRDTEPVADPPRWPSVVAVIAVRDAAPTIGPTVGSLVRQTYPGAFRIVLVDGDSTDGTADAARGAGDGRFALDVVTAPPPPLGWSARLWALAHGADTAGSADFVLLVEPDLLFAPDMLRSLVARAMAGGLVAAMLVPRPRRDTLAARMLGPVALWFALLSFPPRAVNRRGRVAAGSGVMLVARGALATAGGIAAVRDASVPKRALADQLKRRGAIRLLLSDRVEHLPRSRSNDLTASIAQTVRARLISPIARIAGFAALLLVFAGPPLLALLDTGLSQLCAVAAWVLMVVALQPVLRVAHLSPLWGVVFPVTALGWGWFGFVVRPRDDWRNPRDVR